MSQREDPTEPTRFIPSSPGMLSERQKQKSYLKQISVFCSKFPARMLPKFHQNSHSSQKLKQFLKNMPGVWLCLKKSQNCCNSSKSTDVRDSMRTQNDNNRIQRTNTCRFSSGFLRSANLRDLLFTNLGEDKFLQNPTIISSPKSVESYNFLNATNDNVLINHSKRYSDVADDRRSNNIVQQSHRRSCSSASSANMINVHCPHSLRCAGKSLDDSNIYDFGALVCRNCCKKFRDLDAFDAHHLSKHAVTKLVEGDFTRKIVELICHTGRSYKTRDNVLTILKVHNMQKTIAEFEDHREIVKIRASKLRKKHPRCLADGNELLRFHGTTLACSLGLNSTLALCVSDQCGLCRILRCGFSPKTRSNGFNGVHTASTSSRAMASIETECEGNGKVLKALVLCRVIAGRVHKPIEKSEEECWGFSGFDSLAGKMGRDSSFEELYLLSTKALLPCFVIIFKS